MKHFGLYISAWALLGSSFFVGCGSEGGEGDNSDALNPGGSGDPTSTSPANGSQGDPPATPPPGMSSNTPPTPPAGNPSMTSSSSPQPVGTPIGSPAMPTVPVNPPTGGGGDGGSPPMGVGGAGGSDVMPGDGGASGATPNGDAGSGGEPIVGGGGSPPVSNGDLSVTPSEILWTGVRYYPGGTGVNNRTSGPEGGPTQVVQVQNTGAAEVQLEATLSGADLDRYTIIQPQNFPVALAAGASIDIELQMETNNDALDEAPAQDDGATVFEATLSISAGGSALDVRMFGLVLTYVELEPTFGQILDAFEQYDSEISDALRNDANPGSLPGIEAGTDEVDAASFVRASPGPVVMTPLARFSPPGLVPYGYYTPGDTGGTTEVAAMGEESDPHTNNKSRMLNPPLASGEGSFDPGDAPFSIWMEPQDVGFLYTEDGENFDGAHRVKVFTMRDGAGQVIPNTFLIGGEEAANGDYQDYVFVISNVQPN